MFLASRLNLATSKADYFDSFLGVTTFSMMTLSITTFSMMTLSITTFSIAIVRCDILNCDTQHNDRNAPIRITIKNVSVSMTEKMCGSA
jgi:hypothetical protein